MDAKTEDRLLLQTGAHYEASVELSKFDYSGGENFGIAHAKVDVRVADAVSVVFTDQA